VRPWILRMSVNGLPGPGETKFENERGLRSVLDPIAWKGARGRFEVIRPDGQMLTGDALTQWYQLRQDLSPLEEGMDVGGRAHHA
jgi:hypothetical protein